MQPRQRGDRANTSQRPEAPFLRELAEAVVEAGGEVRKEAGRPPHQADLCFVWTDGAQFLVELKAANASRVPLLKGLLSSALLESRQAASWLGFLPLPVIAVDRLSDRTLSVLAEYMQRVAPEAEWGVLDRRGRRWLSGDRFEALQRAGTAVPRGERSSGAAHDLFSDLGQWMAKVMLAPRFPPEMLAAPRVERIRNARHLGQLASVSSPTAARWVLNMRREGFLEDSDRGLQLVRRRAFLESWRRALARPRREVGARFLLPAGAASDHARIVVARYSSERIADFDPDRQSPDPGALVWSQGPRLCLGMLAAAAAHGATRVHGAPVHIYVESISPESIQPLGLVLAKREERADVTLVQPRFPESTFRAAVNSLRPPDARVPVVDVLQTWLEVAEHPARGRQSSEDLGRVIEPWLFGDRERAEAG